MKLLAKILAVVLVLCILATLFVACKKDTEEPVPEGDNTEQGNTNTGNTNTGLDAVSSIEDSEELVGENHNITDDTADAGQFN